MLDVCACCGEYMDDSTLVGWGPEVKVRNWATYKDLNVSQALWFEYMHAWCAGNDHFRLCAGEKSFDVELVSRKELSDLVAASGPWVCESA